MKPTMKDGAKPSSWPQAGSNRENLIVATIRRRLGVARASSSVG
jgi:hypothetical protein